MADSHRLHVQRSARYFTRGADPAEARELWFVLHGYGQLAERFLTAFREIDDGARLIVAPEALNRFYLVPPDSAPAAERPVGATWMTREDRESEIADYLAYLDAVYHDIMEQGPRAERRERAASGTRTRGATVPTVVLGFSQGAATAARWVTRSAYRFDALVLWGGLLPPEVDLGTYARHPASPSLTIVVGTSDKYISPAALDGQAADLDRCGVPYDLVRFPGDHAIDPTALRNFAASFRSSGATY